jgi:hypothetical protein
MISNRGAEVSEWFGMVKAAWGANASAQPPRRTVRKRIEPPVAQDRLTDALAITYCKP